MLYLSHVVVGYFDHRLDIFLDAECSREKLLFHGAWEFSNDSMETIGCIVDSTDVIEFNQIKVLYRRKILASL